MVVAVILAVTAFLTGGARHEGVGAAAVWFGFSHCQVAERFREREAARAVPTVSCHRQLEVYFVGRELLWTTYFVMLGAWSALVGCAVFALYPVWRRYWRRIHPLS